MKDLIERLRGSLSAVDSELRKEAADLIEQMAAALEAKDEAIARHIKVDEFLINCPSDVSAADHIAALDEHHMSLANMRNALAIKWRAYRIERGEVK